MATTEYIEMCTRNKHVRVTPPVGQAKVLIFDIDYCLYHNTEMGAHEVELVKEAYISHSGEPESTWSEHLNSFNLFREIFYHVLGIHPAVFSEKYEVPAFSEYVSADEELRMLLSSIPHRKFCFTNGLASRARAILAHLGIEDLFEAVVCADCVDTEFMCKPLKNAYAFVEQALGVESRESVWFYDDNEKNVQGAIEAGWKGFVVQGDLKEYLREHHLEMEAAVPEQDGIEV